MALNFRLAYSSGIGFVDLFPRTNMEAIIGDNFLSYSTIPVTIPAPSGAGTNQTINITTNEQQVNAPVMMFLTSTGEQAELDYATITQFQVIENQLILTRLYNQPVGNIDIVLVFEEASA